MPGVEILHRVTVGMSDEVSTSIKQSVRRYGAVHFAVREHPLDERDFSFKFYRPEKGDELTNDIIVRIRLHSFEERRANLTDGICTTLSLYIAEDIAKFYEGREIIVGVELMMAEVMWGTGSTMD